MNIPPSHIHTPIHAHTHTNTNTHKHTQTPITDTDILLTFNCKHTDTQIQPLTEMHTNTQTPHSRWQETYALIDTQAWTFSCTYCVHFRYTLFEHTVPSVHEVFVKRYWTHCL